MRVFVYEAITAGAVRWHQPEAQAKESDAGSDGLLAEGLAMLRAVTEDFAAMEGVEVWGLRDARLAQFGLPRREAVVQSALDERAEFLRLANSCDWTLVIAPELDGVLDERVSWLQGTSTRLLSPSGDFLKIASSKKNTAQRLSERGIPVPTQVQEPLEFPLVLKRDDGAGSVGLRLIRNTEELESADFSIPPFAIFAPLREAPLQDMSITQRRKDRGEDEKYRLEPFCAGLPASVAILCGPAGNVALQPCEQRLDPATLVYLGGSTPLPGDLEKRARSLALAAITAMPPTIGYVGVDIVLGEMARGSQDVVIEINPRLTTSYVGLRQACRQNLAQAMLDAACGRPVALSFRQERVEFRADGGLQSECPLFHS